MIGNKAPSTKEDRMERTPEALIELVRCRALNIFLTNQLFCSETVMSVLNCGLKGGLAPEMAVRLGSGLSEGLGGSGCLCGAVNGGILALGLFLGRNGPGFGNAGPAMKASKDFHSRFQKRFGSSCCKVLTRKFKNDHKAHFHHCAELTAFAAETSAGIVLKYRPELLAQADWSFLSRQDSRVKSNLKKLTGLIR